jgi:hypothetical protein
MAVLPAMAGISGKIESLALQGKIRYSIRVEVRYAPVIGSGIYKKSRV